MSLNGNRRKRSLNLTISGALGNSIHAGIYVVNTSEIGGTWYARQKAYNTKDVSKQLDGCISIISRINVYPSFGIQGSGLLSE